MLKKSSIFILIVGLTALLLGCNTMQGVGKDVKKMGAAIERSAS